MHTENESTEEYWSSKGILLIYVFMTSKLCFTLYNNERRGEKENEKEKEIKKKNP